MSVVQLPKRIKTKEYTPMNGFTQSYSCEGVFKGKVCNSITFYLYTDGRVRCVKCGQDMKLIVEEENETPTP
jgi:hypothetical protein